MFDIIVSLYVVLKEKYGFNFRITAQRLQTKTKKRLTVTLTVTLATTVFWYPTKIRLIQMGLAWAMLATRTWPTQIKETSIMMEWEIFVTIVAGGEIPCKYVALMVLLNIVFLEVCLSIAASVACRDQLHN